MGKSLFSQKANSNFMQKKVLKTNQHGVEIAELQKRLRIEGLLITIEAMFLILQEYLNSKRRQYFKKGNQVLVAFFKDLFG